MKELNTHGITINNLKEASAETCTCHNGSYIQVFYDTETCDIYTHFHASENNWTQYKDKAVVLVCNTTHHLTMQQIADAVAETLANIKACEQYM